MFVFMDELGFVDHETFVKQLADAEADSIDVFLFDDSVYNAAKVLEDGDRANDRIA